MIFQESKPSINKEEGSIRREYYIKSSETVLMVRWVRDTSEFNQPYKQTESKKQVKVKISSNK